MHMLKSLYCSLSISWYSACLSPTTKHSRRRPKTVSDIYPISCASEAACQQTDMPPSAGLIFANSIPTAPSTEISPSTLFFCLLFNSSQHCTSLHFWCACCHPDPDYILCPINHNLCHNSIPPRPGSIKERGENTCSINEGRSQGCNLLTYWSQSKNPPHKTFFHWFVSFFVVFFQDFCIAQSSVIRK